MAKREEKRSFKSMLPYILLIIILSYDLIHSIVFVGGPSYFGDDVAYMGLAAHIVMGTFGQSAFDTHSIRILQDSGIAFFIKLFGVNLYSLSAWDILGFMGGVAVAFFFAKEVYNEKAGVIAALLLSFYPGLIEIAATGSDNPPLMFIASLAILAIVYAKRKGSKAWYFIAGALLIAAPLISPEGFIIILVAVAYLLIELLRKKITINRTSLFFVYGVAFALLILFAANSFTTNPSNPFITIAGTAKYHISESPPYPTANLAYISMMFPKIWPYQYTNQEEGYYFYAFIIAAPLIFIWKKGRPTYLLLFWPAIVFLYLSFGPILVAFNPFQYILIDRLGRYLLLMMVPVVTVIAIGLVKVLEKAKRRIPKMLSYVIVAAIVVFLIATAIPQGQFWNNMLAAQRSDQLVISNYLSTVPNYTRIYFTNDANLATIYMSNRNLSRFILYDSIQNCNEIKNNSYVIMPRYSQVNGLNWTPDPLKYCPNWQLVMEPQFPFNVSPIVNSTAHFQRTNLWYVP